MGRPFGGLGLGVAGVRAHLNKMLTRIQILKRNVIGLGVLNGHIVAVHTYLVGVGAVDLGPLESLGVAVKEVAGGGFDALLLAGYQQKRQKEKHQSQDDGGYTNLFHVWFFSFLTDAETWPFWLFGRGSAREATST